MKEIICRAYNKKEKKWYWFDVMWGDKHGNMWMLPDGEKREKRTGGINGIDNRIRVDPFDWEISVGLSPYMPCHSEVGNEDCCGIFMAFDEDNHLICNECGMDINDALRQLKEKNDRKT